MTPGAQPHIYGIAAKAVSELQRTEENQSILLSGESGAGKVFCNR
jgi:myosin heavy subunit